MMMAASVDKPESGPSGSKNEAAAAAAAAVGLLAGNVNNIQAIRQPSQESASSLFCLSLLRSACDACWRKKSRCSGEMPCERCKRAGVQCSYSTKRKLGRPKRSNGRSGAAAEQRPSAAKKRKRLSHQACYCMASPSSPSFSPSPATALAGLPESKYLSFFLEHFCPM